MFSVIRDTSGKQLAPHLVSQSSPCLQLPPNMMQMAKTRSENRSTNQAHRVRTTTSTKTSVCLHKHNTAISRDRLLLVPLHRSRSCTGSAASRRSQHPARYIFETSNQATKSVSPYETTCGWRLLLRSARSRESGERSNPQLVAYEQVLPNPHST
jgi:hypothetical protein